MNTRKGLSFVAPWFVAAFLAGFFDPSDYMGIDDWAFGLVNCPDIDESRRNPMECGKRSTLDF